MERDKDLEMDREDENIFVKIQKRLPQMSKSQRTIALYVSEHYDQAVFMTAARLGGELGISESTVIRFAAQLGYKGYPEFQNALERCFRDKLKAAEKEDNAGTNNIGTNNVCPDVSVLAMRSDMEQLINTMEQFNSAAFETAVKDILEAETVYVMGLRGDEPLAVFLHFYLHIIRSNVILLRSSNMSEIFEQMIRINKKDCFIGISFPRYSVRTLKAMEFANDRNARVIAITDDVNSPMNLYSSCNLLAKSETISIVNSLVAPMSLLNALIAAMCRRRAKEVKKNLDLLADAWNNYQVYLNDEIDVINEEDLGLK